MPKDNPTCGACGGSCSYAGRPNEPCWGTIASVDGRQESGHYCEGHSGAEFGEAYIRDPEEEQSIDFAMLANMIQRLPQEYRDTKTAFIMDEAIYLRTMRRMRKIGQRTLYGLRMIAKGDGISRARSDRMARSDFAARSSLPQHDLSRACQAAISLATADDLFPDRGARDRWLGNPDLFVCCGGRGFHDAIGVQLYCPCAAGRRRAELDRGSP